MVPPKWERIEDAVPPVLLPEEWDIMSRSERVAYLCAALRPFDKKEVSMGKKKGGKKQKKGRKPQKQKAKSRRERCFTK